MFIFSIGYNYNNKLNDIFMMLSCSSQEQGYLFIIISSKEFLFLLIYSEYIFIRFIHVLLFLFLLYMALSLPLFPLSGNRFQFMKPFYFCFLLSLKSLMTNSGGKVSLLHTMANKPINSTCECL